MNFLSSLIMVISSASLLSLGIPNEVFNFGNSIMGLVCFIPLYYAFFMSNSKHRTAFMYSLFVTLTHLFSSFWLIHFQDFAIFTLGASSVAYFVLAYPFGLFFYYIFKYSDIKHRPFLFALTITLWEYFKSSGFTAYPWGVISMTALSLHQFIQFIDVTGVWGLSYILALIGAVETETLLSIFGLTDGLKKCKKRPLVIPLLITIFLISIINIYGFFALRNSESPEKNISLLLVQQNIDPWYDSMEESVKVGMRLTREALKKNKDIDLVVWSESSLSRSYEDYKDWYELIPNDDPFIPFLREIDCPILIGTPLTGKEDSSQRYNGVALLDESGDILQTYAKMQLVPFAEFLPFIDHPIVKKFFNRLVGFSSGWAQGQIYKLFSIKTKKGDDVFFTTPICYEDAFPSLCASLHEKGSDLLINLTNDSWSKIESAEYQHFAIAYFRAIELRTSLVRSTNGGYTCVINPKGEVLNSLPLFREGTLSVDVPIYSHKTTPYALFKDWLPLLLFVILILYIWKKQTLYIKKQKENIYYTFHWKKDSEEVFVKTIKLSRMSTRVIKIIPVSPKIVKLKKGKKVKILH
ncbi:MAG: apolipoprotein N-acyltransferase [Treponema sp.]